MIEFPYTSSNPKTVVIETRHTSVALITMFSSQSFQSITRHTQLKVLFSNNRIMQLLFFFIIDRYTFHC
jgi:hypothetical protein